MKTLLTPEEIAKVCHEVNKAYCEALGDFSQKDFDKSPKWQKDSALNGVMFHLNNPDLTPEDSHVNWYNEKLAEGWRYGEVKDVSAKTHPCMVAYDDLPVDQKAKDHIFKAIVTSLGGIS